MLKLTKIIFNIMLVTSVLILALLWLRKYDLFVINRVKVIGNKLLTKEEIIELAAIDFSQEVFKIDVDAIKKRLLTDPLIKEAAVSRYLPSAIKIQVKEMDLIANITCSELSTLDSDGNIVNTKKILAFYDLPVITGTKFNTDSLGNRVASQQMYKMIEILKFLRLTNFELYHEISEINYNKNYGILLYLRKKTIPIIFGFDNYLRKINYLSAVYEVLKKKSELSSLKVIDVRFNGQVVVRN